jgi:hypothetical protein
MSRRAKNPRVVLCAYCHNPAELLPDSTPLYGKDYGPVWRCELCKAWVGVHKGTTRPLGRLANAELRVLKQRAHAAFDPIWKSGLMNRGDAYAWLSDQLGIELKDTHVGMMDEQQCLLVETVALWWRDGRRAA